MGEKESRRRESDRADGGEPRAGVARHAHVRGPETGRPCFGYPPDFYRSARDADSNRRAAARSRSFQATRSRQWSGMPLRP